MSTAFDDDLFQEGLGHTLAGTPTRQLNTPGLGSDLAGVPGVPATPSYIDVYTYPGEHGFPFGHTALSINGGRAYGLEPIPGQDVASVLQTVRGYVQPVPKERVPNQHVRIPVTADQAERARQYILSNAGDHGYALGGPNCVSFVQGALGQAGIRDPEESQVQTPADLLEGLSQMFGNPHLVDTRPTLPKY